MFKRSFTEPCCMVCNAIPLIFPPSNLQSRSSLLSNVNFGLFFPRNVNIKKAWILRKHGTINKEYLHVDYRIITQFQMGTLKL